MKKYILLISIIALFVSACAPRYAVRKQSPRNKKDILRKSYDRLREAERANRDYRLGKVFFPIRALMGAPYKFGGDSRRGIDCSGFVALVFKESFNIKLPHNASQQYYRSRRIAASDLRLGDLVFFSMNGNGNINHVGIYLGKNYFAHASTSYGVIISSLSEKYYRSRYVGAGRILD